MKIYKTLLWFCEQMQKALNKNSYKGGWKGCGTEYLFEKLTEEYEEVMVYSRQSLIDKNIKKKLTAECADLANIAMMLADEVKR